MKHRINLPKKFRSKTFIVSMFSALLLLIQAVGTAFGYNLEVVSEKITDVFNACLSVLVISGIVIDTGITAYENGGIDDEN